MSANNIANDLARAIAGVLIDLTESIEPVTEATIGYRNHLVDGGMTPEAADRCAADFHHWVLALMVNTNKEKK